jgi:hypothetical protein
MGEPFLKSRNISRARALLWAEDGSCAAPAEQGAADIDGHLQVDAGKTAIDTGEVSCGQVEECFSTKADWSATCVEKTRPQRAEQSGATVRAGRTTDTDDDSLSASVEGMGD